MKQEPKRRYETGIQLSLSPVPGRFKRGTCGRKSGNVGPLLLGKFPSPVQLMYNAPDRGRQ